MGEAKRINTGTHFMMGNQACTEGVIAAGCGFAAGYPITPASEVFNSLCKQLPKAGGTLLQTEDEIAAVCAAIGASWTGLEVHDRDFGTGHQPDAGEHRSGRGHGDAPGHRRCPAAGTLDGCSGGRHGRRHGAGRPRFARRLPDHRHLSGKPAGDVRHDGAGLQPGGGVPRAGLRDGRGFCRPHAGTRRHSR